jgi:hypothetical protein
LAWVLYLLVAVPWAKINTAVWHVAVSGQDSLFCEGLARDISQALAEDSALKVFDARRRGAGLLDTLFQRGPHPDTKSLLDVLPNKMELAIAVSCRTLESSLECRTEGRFLTGRELEVEDTARFHFDALVKRRLFGACIARAWRETWHGTPLHWPASTKLVLTRPAMPARLLRDLEILSEGSIAEMPPGTQLETGDMAVPALANKERVSYVFFAGSEYAYPLPNVLQLNRGTLGVWHLQDTNTLAAKLMQTTRLDSTNLLWRTMGKLAALDTTNLVWKTLGKANLLDSQNIVTRKLREMAALDSTNLLYKTIGEATSLDSSNLLIRSLSQVASMDSTNLVWRGLAQIATLDSTNLLWRKLSQVASLDSGFIWHQLGLLAFQDSSVLITPSCVLRGQPQVMKIHHQGSETRIELVQGEVAVLPLLSSQNAVRIPNLNQAVTRGFAIETFKMQDRQSERISTELAQIAAPKSGRSLAEFLPARLFNRNRTLPVFRADIQDFLMAELAGVDAAPDRLGPIEWDASESLPTMQPGKYEIGCYLCRPDRLGP